MGLKALFREAIASLVSGRKEAVSPESFAVCLVPIAASHLKALIADTPSQQNRHVWDSAFCELLRAYFCLASLYIVPQLKSDDFGNHYGSRMLKQFCNYPDLDAVLVRKAFADSSITDEAIMFYIHNVIEPKEASAISESRKLHSTKEDVPMLAFIAKIDVRIAGILGIPFATKEYLFMHYENAACILAASEQFQRIKPTLN